MNLIDTYLRKEHSALYNTKKNDQEAKLAYFYELFTDLERKYQLKLEDIKRLDLERKNELNNLEVYIHQVKQLTDEREELTNTFKEENQELRAKLEALEEHINELNDELNNKSSRDVESEDDLSEATVEMLVMEGFGNIVAAPTHEKIAVILADRARLVDEVKSLNKSLHALNGPTNSADSKCANNELKVLSDKIEILEQELEIMKSSNVKLSNELDNYKLQIEKSNPNNEEETRVLLENMQFEANKLKEDNLNLKMEIEKLYDEISSFEVENKQLKDEKLLHINRINQLEVDTKKSTQHEAKIEEIKKLKQEIEDLNNELDELVPFKISYEKLKLDYDKLILEQQEAELAKTLKKGNVDSDGASTTQNKAQLELEWIRSENEKLLVDLETTQNKLNEKCAQYNELKAKYTQKEEEIKEFLDKFEKKQTTDDDLLHLQKKIIDLEQLLNAEKEERAKEIETNEERQKDLLKRNDQLWSKMTKLDKTHKDAMEALRHKNKANEELEMKLSELNKNISDLKQEKQNEILLKEKAAEKNDLLESNINELNKKLAQLKQSYDVLSEQRTNENQLSQSQIDKLNASIEGLNERIDELNKENTRLNSEIESLNKEKQFIISQNDNTHQKVLNDFLALQERHTSTSYEFNKLKNDYASLTTQLKERENVIANLEVEKSQINLTLKQEKDEKKDALDQVKSMDATLLKNVEKINDLSDKIQRLESQKSKLEQKMREYEMLQLKHEQLNNELTEKCETLSQILEKNGKLEAEISALERELNETRHSLIKSDSVINELNHFRSDTMQRAEENIKLKHEFETEKTRREKAESKLTEIKEDFKKLKQKLSKLQEENNELKQQSVETKNELDSLRSKLNFVSDKTNTEHEKNNALQDELSATKKQLELLEIKCNSYSQKFDILMKRYETRKVKHKNKIERLWNYLQKERNKYKELLANAQNELNLNKTLIEKENEQKCQQENSYKQIVAEKSKLVATLADKESLLRDLKRQNIHLKTKIKYLEDEMNSLNEKVDSTIRERNKLRKEIQINLATSLPIENLSDSPKSNQVSTRSATKGHQSNRMFDLKSLAEPATAPGTTIAINGKNLTRSFRSASFNYWNDLNATSSWDVNYNTGYLSKYNRGDQLSMSSKTLNTLNGPLKDLTYASMATDLNSVASTPRSYR